MNRVRKFYREDSVFKFNFTFDQTVVKMLYREGVFPAQGARSVLSTVQSVLEPTLARFVFEFIRNNHKGEDVAVRFNRDENGCIFEWGGNRIIRIPVVLKLDEFRIPKRDNESVVHAVHEGGHILGHILALGVFPNKATCFGVGYGTDGRVTMHFDEVRSLDSEKRLLIGGLSGWAAECVIFGEPNVTIGAKGDIQKTTAFASQLIDRCGFGSEVSTKSRAEGGENESKIGRTRKHDKEIEKMVRNARDEAVRIMTDNKHALLRFAEELLSVESMSKQDIIAVTEDLGLQYPEPFDYEKLSKERPFLLRAPISAKSN
jgi:cell division protease FtsH